jgi:hypothetical protein
VAASDIVPGCERDIGEARSYETLMAALRERLSRTQMERLAADGAALTEEQATFAAFGR